MRRSGFRWGRSAAGGAVSLHLAGAAAGRRVLRRRVRPTEEGSPRRAGPGRAGWIWPAIGVLIFVEVLLLGGHAVRWAKRTRHFAVREVVVTGHRRLPGEAVRKLAGVAPGTNIFDADLAAVRARVIAHPWIKGARVRMRPPHSLLVDIRERIPAARIGGAAPLVVDAEGVVLDTSAPYPAGCLPVLEGFGSRRPRPGEAVRDPRLARSVAAGFLFRDSPAVRGACISVRDAGRGELRLRARGGRTVELMVHAERMARQAGRLRAVADDVLRQKRFGAGGLQFDLRFPGRVIVRPLTTKGGTRG